MEKNFELFLLQLAETNATLESYCDFTKIKKNVHRNDIFDGPYFAAEEVI